MIFSITRCLDAIFFGRRMAMHKCTNGEIVEPAGSGIDFGNPSAASELQKGPVGTLAQ